MHKGHSLIFVAPIEKLLAGSFEHWKARSDDTFWAWQEVNDLCCNLEAGFEITRRLVESASDGMYLYYGAAGPVEDLIVRQGLPALALLEQEADDSERMRDALAGVWLNPLDHTFEELSRILRKYLYAKRKKVRKTPFEPFRKGKRLKRQIR
jgi:hypothetical protein